MMIHLQLTNREKQVLYLIAYEQTTPQIAKRLFVSPNTIITYRKKLLNKFNVKNIAGLVRVAMEQNLLVNTLKFD